MVGEDSACIVILVSKARLWFVSLDICECYSTSIVSIDSGAALSGFPEYLRRGCLISSYSLDVRLTRVGAMIEKYMVPIEMAN
ncbi:hypothetical protein D9M72_382480 [compost metagenome]